ncbi:uncharacterized protein B0H18DRAFT_961516 [Fomitopsis serialis]|uniref:uncharacterized protein n=1 Tax=Fomitopsis serialis TaxID=139415 RepID=UPI00200786E7|nr:uncharacterized protein B0H18DRAFT_961516 [Neoantrodia serialis]KAH9911973.1 hypothetical protein B0H18DRAFT_961516 [Neoantrodia serialis]
MATTPGSFLLTVHAAAMSGAVKLPPYRSTHLPCQSSSYHPIAAHNALYIHDFLPQFTMTFNLALARKRIHTYAQPPPPSSNTVGIDSESTPAAESPAGDEPAPDDEGRHPTKGAKYEGPAKHKCIWRFKDGSRRGGPCAQRAQPRASHPPEPPQAPVQCGWGPCQFRGLPGDTYQHWRTAHQPTMAKTKTAGEGGAKPKTQCAVCARGKAMRPGTLIKYCLKMAAMLGTGYV